MIAIRAMGAHDLDQVLALEGITPEAPHWDRAVYERLLVPDESGAGYIALAAFDDRALAGFIVARQILEVCEIESIAVAEGFRRMGVGRVLLDAVSRRAQALGTERIQLEVRAGNQNAIRFYEKAGLTKEGVRRRYYRSPEEDAVLMGKSLNSRD